MLDWHRHIDHCKNKISSGLYAINTAKNIMPAKQLKTLYYSLIHPYLNYGILLWGGTHKSYTHKLQVLQNKAIRVINNYKYNESASPIYRKLNIMTYDNMYKLESCKFMYMNSKNEIPSPLIELFTRNTDIHNYNTRHSKDVHIQSRTSDQTSRSFPHQSPKLWLTIPEVIKNAKSLASTISQGKKYFSDNE